MSEDYPVTTPTEPLICVNCGSLHVRGSAHLWCKACEKREGGTLRFFPLMGLRTVEWEAEASERGGATETAARLRKRAEELRKATCEST